MATDKSPYKKSKKSYDAMDIMEKYKKKYPKFEPNRRRLYVEYYK